MLLYSIIAQKGGYAFSACSNLMSMTIPDFAAQYCKENDLHYTYPDSLDWLNN